MTPRYRIEKLVRDLIPDVIRADGLEPDVRRVDETAVRPFVALKVIEEAFEVFEAVASGDPAKLTGELADLMEVVDRLMRLQGLTWADIDAERARKNAKRGAFEDNWLLADPPGQRQRLYSHLDRPLLKALEQHLAICSRAHLAVSFVMKSGLRLLEPALRKALARGVQIRLLTSDYLDVTEPEALAQLLALPGSLELRAYREPSRAYHPKAYLFEHADGLGAAFIGSSNLSASALQHGVEWNYEVMGTDEGWPLAELISKFDAIFDSPYAERIDADFVAAYAARRRVRTFLEPELGDLPESEILPRPAQLEALAQLDALRAQGETRGMVVAATGIGKTFLAAFDSRPFARVLFLAHRDELLTQAREAFARVRPEARLGYYRSGEYDTEAELVFASVATLSRSEHLKKFAPDHFDYLVVDEFHHAAAKSYDAVLHYFAPRFLLGLTATPYRADNRDVFALCDGNVAYRVTFMEAIAFGWLAPFRYHGIYDETNYDTVEWRNGRYDVEALSRAVETRARAQAVLTAFREHPSRACIGFCVSIAHARFMADYFTEQGVPSLAVHSGPDAPERAHALGQLRRGEVKVLFTVDLFNEGVDVPEIDLVLFLRPTESATIFLQQLGRGLRLCPGKEYLTALDFIGNYKKAHHKVALIAGAADGDPDPAALRKLIAQVPTEEFLASLPAGVAIEFDLRVIDLLTRFAKQGEPRRERLAQAFESLETELGHRPSLLELHRQGIFDVKAYRQEWGSWFGFLKAHGKLTPAEMALDACGGELLAFVEKTPMTKSYKMVLLQAFLDAGGLTKPVTAQALAATFRAFFLASKRHHRDLQGTEIEQLEAVSEQQLVAYLVRNPINAWCNPGKEAKRDPYFAYDAEHALFAYRGPNCGPDLADALRERAAYRLTSYFETRFERKNVFNVINSGVDRGIIMLGSDEAAPIPRGQGWKPVLVGGRRLYAKFAKIAINVLKEQPTDDAGEPNILTETLEAMFGIGGYLPEHGNRVRIFTSGIEPDQWVIEAFRGNVSRE